MDDQSGQTAPAPQNGKKILCIEDEHFISELYARALTKAGYEVTVEVDGEKGLAEAKTDKYDLILLDIMVPNMIGTEVLKNLRGPGTTPPRAKIIITTNLEQEDASRNSIESLADAYVVKAEMTPKQLVDFISRINL